MPDYSGQNLRGCSFKGQNLTGANFSNKDIRGADFSNSILKGADFTGAKAGLQKRWVIGLLVVSYLLSVLSGYLSIVIGLLVAYIFDPNNTVNLFTAVISLVIVAVFCIITIRKGLTASLGFVAGAYVIAVGAAVAKAVAGTVSVAGTDLFALVKAIVESFALAGAVSLAGAVVILAVFCIITIRKGLTASLGFVAGAYAVSTAVSVAGTIAIIVGAVSITLFTGAVAGAFAGILTVTLAVTIAVGGLAAAYVGAIAGAVAKAIAGAAYAKAIAVAAAVCVAFPVVAYFFYVLDAIFSYAAEAKIKVVFNAIFPYVAGAGTGAFTLFSAYIGWCSVKGNEKDAWLRSFALAFAATGGTTFRNADLTDADFTGATLKNTDFRKAKLTRTRFYEVKKLDFARVGDSILTKLDVLKLLVTGNGRGKSYVSANLKGANLIGADLKEANLKNADISKATFQRANLEWANLTLTQAVSTDFTSAQMTGACVEAWNIESTTKLNNVDCRFVYLLENPKPETDDRERRPSSGDFQPGEFTKLFEEVLNTVDLIFRNGIDWKAFVTAFKKVQVENEGTELAIQSIENKGDGVVVVKVGVPDGADKEKIHSDFTQGYQLALQAVEEKYKAQLQAKDNEIVIYRQQSGDMKEIIKLLANKPINVQVDNKVENKNMTNSNDASRNINVGRDFNATGTINLGEISGTVTNTINELPKSDEPEKPGIKELLTQLQTAIEADTNLSEEDKAEALEQVKALAEAGKNPQEGAMQKAAKTAMKILKGTISALPSAATLVEECGKLLPLISGFLGLG